MVLEYPSHLICPNCKNKININYDNVHHKKVAITDDIITFQIGTQQSMNTAKDARNQRKKSSYLGYTLHFCIHCKVILGFSEQSGTWTGV